MEPLDFWWIMRKCDAKRFADKLFGGYGALVRITHKERYFPYRSFVFLVGRRGSDKRFHVYGAGASWDEAVLRARLFVHKLNAQGKLAI